MTAIAIEDITDEHLAQAREARRAKPILLQSWPVLISIDEPTPKRGAPQGACPRCGVLADGLCTDCVDVLNDLGDSYDAWI